MFSYRNFLFYIKSVYGSSVVTRSVGSNVPVTITSYAVSSNGGDHLTSIGTIVIWTIRS